MKNKIKDWLKPDDDVRGTFWFIVVLIVLFLIFWYFVMPNMVSISNPQEECVPNYMGGIDC